MPKCSYCNKNFKDRQALGNHIKTHLYDSDEDSTTMDTTTQIITNKKIRVDYIKQDLNDHDQERVIADFINLDSSNKKSVKSDTASSSGEEYVTSSVDEKFLA